MDYFNAIPVFVMVVKKGSFSAAARELGITKSAVSKRITSLEDHLDAKLMQRTTRKLSLTEAGERYYEHVSKAVVAVQDGEDELSQLQGEPCGRLRISTPMSFGRLHLAPLIPAFLKRYPEIQLEMIMDDKINDLVAGGIDVAIRGGDLSDSSVIARKLTNFRSVICASQEYIDTHGHPSTPSHLQEHNCLLFSYSADSSKWTFTDEMGSQTVEVTGNLKVNNSEVLKEALLQGLGVGRLPTFVADMELQLGKLLNLFPNHKMPTKSMYAVFTKREYMPAKVKTFIEYIREHLAPI